MSNSKRYSYLQPTKYYDLQSSNLLDRHTNQSNSNMMPSTLISVLNRGTIDGNRFRSSFSHVNYSHGRESNQIFEETGGEFI